MISLIERIEAATGPDRELDALIWCALNGKKYVGWFEPNGEEGRATAVEYTEPPKRTILVTHSKGHAHPYTSSIDAALTLVPDDAMWRLGHDRKDGDPSEFLCEIVSGPECRNYCKIAQTAALALCAAALRARGVM